MRAVGKFAKGAAFAAVLGALLAFSTNAAAQGNCAMREIVILMLAESYGEARQSIAMTSTGQVVETFANLGTGTWTLTVTTPEGLSCLVASGQSYERVSEVVDGDPT